MAGSADCSIKPDLSYRPQTVATNRAGAQSPSSAGGGVKVSKVQLATAPLRLPYIIRQRGSNGERREGGGQDQDRVLLPGTAHGPSRGNLTAPFH